MQKKKDVWLLRIGEEGEIRLPTVLADTMGLKTGDSLEFKEIENDGAELLKA